MNVALDRKDPGSFEVLAEEFKGLIFKTVLPFTRDKMLSRVESQDGLVNICLVKLSQAWRDYIYDPGISEEHNERRFIALFKTYMRNALIDRQYSANLRIRNPEVNIDSINQIRDENDEEANFDISDFHQCNPLLYCIADENSPTL